MTLEKPPPPPDRFPPFLFCFNRDSGGKIISLDRAITCRYMRQTYLVSRKEFAEKQEERGRARSIFLVALQVSRKSDEKVRVCTIRRRVHRSRPLQFLHSLLRFSARSHVQRILSFSARNDRPREIYLPGAHAYAILPIRCYFVFRIYATGAIEKPRIYARPRTERDYVNYWR